MSVIRFNLVALLLMTLLAAFPKGGLGMKKKYILRIPMAANLGGAVNPLGDMLIYSNELLLSRINNQTEVLRDYNVIIDVYDDQCADWGAIRAIVPAMRSWTDITDLSITKPNLRISTEPIENGTVLAFTPPYFVGGVCSTPCKATGRLPQYFDLFQLAVGCLEPYMDYMPGYKNYFRLSRSVAEYPDARIEVALSLGWTNVAIFCDMNQYMFQDTQNFMRALNRRGLPILATEFAAGDPTDALSRLKAADARIIFALCFLTNCPTVVCIAYKMKLYGPNIVWIFNSETDLSSNWYRPPGCPQAWYDDFLESSLYFGADFAASSTSDFVSASGLTANEVTRYILQKSPKALVTFSAQWRIFTFEAAHNGIFVAAEAERRLQRRNETLMTFASDPKNYDALRVLFLDVITNFQSNTTTGLGSIVRMDEKLNDRGNARSTNRSYTTPPFVVQQIQRGIRKDVMVLAANSRLKFLKPFVWRTASGDAPFSEPAIRVVQKGVSLQAAEAIKVLAIILVVGGIVCAIALLRPTFRSKHGNSFPEMNAVVLLGTSAPLVALLIYPWSEHGASFESMNKFCLGAPILIVLGASLSVGGLGVKFWTNFLYRVDGSIADFPNIRLKSYLMLIFHICVEFAILAAVYAGNDSRPTAVQIVVNVPSNEPCPQVLDVEKWWTCSCQDFTIGWVVIGAHALFAIISIIVSLMAKRLPVKVFISDLKTIQMGLYVLLTLEIIFIFAMLAIYSYDTQFGVLSAYSFCQMMVNLCFVFFWKFRPEPTPEVSVRTSAGGPLRANTIRHSKNKNSPRPQSRGSLAGPTPNT